MTLLPQWLMRHTATIRPFLGDGAYGPVFGEEVTERCLADDERRLVRDADGTEVVSDLTLYMRPGVVCPPGSEVTVNGRTTTVIVSHARDGGGLPTPDHVEVACT
ncbi:hypothetical protein Ppa06_58230 [Planomonospora parontospora subsp. parontospora]|uniref:Head-to-tail stopper n=3 Tax=Planomonospora TaxID=1998 RepID=A0AA37F754_9ACTN|nr:hypothetical protein [Planomonospora parontospora]GGK90254.1 hypothetical protein GCM10010126_57080 [Planomonospora parontospora]GII12025.1 hypothetical protein Ppa06_58230 [Planomonospora parontospora subsp. parontospora]